MAEQTVIETPPVDTPVRSYVDWPAILAGAVIASGAMAVLTAFAGGLGLSSITADDGGDISVTWLVLTALFVILSMVGSYMLGGYITGRMRRPTGETVDRDELTFRDGMNGLVVWGIGTIISGLLAIGVVSGGVKAAGTVATTAIEATGAAVGGAAQGAGSVVAGVAQGAGAAAGPTMEQMLPGGFKANPVDYFTDVLLRTDPQIAQMDDAQNMAYTQRQISGILGTLLSSGEISDADRIWLTNQIVARTGLSPTDAEVRVAETTERIKAVRAEAQTKIEEAQKQVEEARTQAEKAVEDAKVAAADAAEKARITGILTAFLLGASALVAAVAAYIGAVHGGRHRDEGRIWGGLSYRN
ncbi:hypothetical protein [Agrobacterium sp.]|uniref:hypothetical protein n=1 Tax=Agrobacterium sp. TaxID=361 RepID=UPI0028AAE02D|nr:hypothetical protein [Agrobacterium sp.]